MEDLWLHRAKLSIEANTDQGLLNLTALIDRLNLDNLEVDLSNQYLNESLIYALKVNNEAAFNLLLQAWANTYYDELSVESQTLQEIRPIEPFVHRMFRYYAFNDKLLRFLADSLDISFLYLVEQALEKVTGLDIADLINRARRIFGQQSAQTYQTLMAKAKHQDNDLAHDVLGQHYQVVSAYAKKPTYMVNDWPSHQDKPVIEEVPLPEEELGTAGTGYSNLTVEGGLVSPQELRLRLSDPEVIQANPQTLPSQEEVVIPANYQAKPNLPAGSTLSRALDLLIDLFNQGNLTIETEVGLSPQATLRQLLEEADQPEELITSMLDVILTKELLLQRWDDSLIFRVLGPANPDPGLPVDQLVLGGSRMLEESPVSGPNSQPIDWFTGNCYQCYLKIIKRWYATRLPLPGGGWYGCFCSWSCCRDWAEEQEMIDGDHADVTYLFLIDLFQRQCQEFQIQDRRGGTVPIQYPPVVVETPSQAQLLGFWSFLQQQP